MKQRLMMKIHVSLVVSHNLHIFFFVDCKYITVPILSLSMETTEVMKLFLGA
jgi:hypothetical protein